MGLSARNKLAYPVGFTAGYDPTHPAAYKPILSVVAIPGEIAALDLLTGAQQNTFVTSPGTFMHGAIGPSLSFLTAASSQNLQISGPTVTPTAVSIAAICVPTVASIDGGLLSDNGNWWFQLGNTGQFEILPDGATRTFSSNTYLVNTPYFVAASADNASGTVRMVVTNLSTGQIYTSTGTTGNIVPLATPYSMGNGNSPFNNQPTQGYISAVMFSQANMSMTQLLQWAADPWAYWYPDADQALVGTTGANSFSLSLAGGTYTLTGSAATLNAGMPLSGGSYALAGSSATLGAGESLSGGTYTLIGNTNTFGITSPLSGGSYSLTGTSNTLDAGIPLSSGTYALTGSSVNLVFTPSSVNMPLAGGSYTLSGNTLSLVYTPSQPTVGGRQIHEDELFIASHKWHQRQLEAEYSNISAVAAELGSLGGHARAKALSAKHRSAIATKAAIARWR